MIEQIDALLKQAETELAQAADEQHVESVRVKYLGKSGSLSGLRKGMGSIPAADRPRVGKLVTDAIARVEALIEEAKKAVARRELEKDLHREKLDVMSGVSAFPMRVKCATLAWHTMKSALEGGAAAKTE